MVEVRGRLLRRPVQIQARPNLQPRELKRAPELPLAVGLSQPLASPFSSDAMPACRCALVPSFPTSPQIAEPILKHDALTGVSILFHEIKMNITISMPKITMSANYLTASSAYCGEVKGWGVARAISAGLVGACKATHGIIQGTASSIFTGVFNGILSSGGLDQLLGRPLEIPLDLTNVLNPVFGNIKIKHDAINSLCSFIVRAHTSTLACTPARAPARTISDPPTCSRSCSHYF